MLEAPTTHKPTWAESFETFHYASNEKASIAKNLRPMISQFASKHQHIEIVDIGCGDLEQTTYLLEGITNIRRHTGFDPNWDSIYNANRERIQRRQRLHKWIGQVRAESFSECSLDRFDDPVCLLAIHSLFDDDRKRELASIRKALMNSQENALCVFVAEAPTSFVAIVRGTLRSEMGLQVPCALNEGEVQHHLGDICCVKTTKLDDQWLDLEALERITGGRSLSWLGQFVLAEMSNVYFRRSYDERREIEKLIGKVIDQAADTRRIGIDDQVWNAELYPTFDPKVSSR
jgi:hypothetical protein